MTSSNHLSKTSIISDPTARLGPEFFLHNTVFVAQRLLGKTLSRRFPDGTVKRYRITETEAYCGTQDKACHANKGRTPRTEVMFGKGGKIYVYLIYGQYWLLNFVTEDEQNASAVLIRGLEGFPGPGRLGRELQLDKSFYGEDLETSDRIWIEDAPDLTGFSSTPRININYAGEPWTSKLWRFFV